MSEVSRVYLFPNEIKDPEFQFTRRVLTWLLEKNREIFLEDRAETRALFASLQKEIGLEHTNACFLSRSELKRSALDLCLVIGGDGTFLSCIHQLQGTGVPILGVNLGTVGYLAEVEKDQVEEALTRIIAGDFRIEERFLLEAHLGEHVFYAANEMTIQRPLEQGILALKTYVSDTLLTTFQADGLIVSTPTGSTGYSLSLGGPILSPEADSLLLTPMANVGRLGSSVVIPGSDTVRVIAGDEKRETFGILTSDGKLVGKVGPKDTVLFQKSSHTFCLAKVTDTSFYETVQKKFV